MDCKPDWAAAQQRFEQWWRAGNQGRPLFRIHARREQSDGILELETPWRDREAPYLDVEELSLRYRNYCRTHRFLGEAFPSLDLNLGPGSLALYLGTQPDFQPDTVWFKEWVEDWEKLPPLMFRKDDVWFRQHLGMIRRAVELAKGRYLVNIPDLVENIDILAAMRGPQPLCYDLYDFPEKVQERLDQLETLYFPYYNAFYQAVQGADQSSSFTAFEIWGKGKTAKVQCDFCALLSPAQFGEFVLPSLNRQCAGFNHAMYHLDGPDAIKHLDALLTIKGLQVVQWSHGAGNPDGLSSQWYEPIYDKVTQAGRSLLIYGEDGSPKDWIKAIDHLVERYSSRGLYIQLPEMEEREGEWFMETAEQLWG